MKLNDKIDEMFNLREKKRLLEAEIKEISADLAACKLDLINRCAEVGTVTARGTLASIVVTETLVPRIDDWGLISDWVMANDGVYLLHRRVSSGAWKELLDAGIQVPGIDPFNKVDISLTKLRD